MMKAVLYYYDDVPHHKQGMALMAEGLRRHGFATAFSTDDAPKDADLVVMWGYRRQEVIDAAARRGTPVLVMERGHVQPRMVWTSCGFNGLGRRALYPAAPDGGARWNKHFAHHLQPWRSGGDYVLVCGQLPGDVALQGSDIRVWAQNAIDTLRAKGHAVRYRPHPYVALIGENWLPENATISTCPIAKDFYDPSLLAEDLRDASMVVTFNSTSGVECVLTGIPTVTMDEGAMAWPVTTHDLAAPPHTPDRTAWCHDLAWTQWLPEEIQNGETWAAARGCVGM